MERPRRSLIVALADNGVIGRQGQLPWRLSADLKQFRRLTLGHHLVMGRKTYESIGRPLPGRTSIVITRQPDYQAAGCLVAASIEAAFALAAGDTEVFVIGGSEIYRVALPLINRMYMTRVMAHVEGDTYFPEYKAEQWRLVEDEAHSADAINEYPFRFQVYDRIA